MQLTYGPSDGETSVDSFGGARHCKHKPTQTNYPRLLTLKKQTKRSVSTISTKNYTEAKLHFAKTREKRSSKRVKK